MDSLKKLFECNICNGEILNPNQIQCGHILCNCCIKKWLENKKGSAQCPECQIKINRRALKSREDITDLMSKFMKLKELFEKEAYESQIISNSESPEKVEECRENNKFFKRTRRKEKETTFPRLILQNSSKRSNKSNIPAESPESKRQKVEESEPVPDPDPQTYSTRTRNVKSSRKDKDSSSSRKCSSITSNLQKLDENEEEIDLVEESVFDDEELVIEKEKDSSQISKPPELQIEDRNVDDMEIEFVPLKGSEDLILNEIKGKPIAKRGKYAPSQKDIFAMTEMNEESDDEAKLRDIEKDTIEEDHLFLDKSIAEAETQVSDIVSLDNEIPFDDENNLKKESSNKLEEKQGGDLKNIEIDVEKSNTNQPEGDQDKQLMRLNPVEIEVEVEKVNLPLEPLDLSMPKKFVSKYVLPKIKYALQFVKPLDLSSSSKLIYTSKGSLTSSVKNEKKAPSTSSETESSENFYTPNYLAYLAEAEQDNGMKTPSLSRLRNTSLFREISGVNSSSQKINDESPEEDIVGKYYKNDDESLMSLKESQEREQEILRKDSQDQNSMSQKINHLSSNSNGNDRVDESESPASISIVSKTPSQEKAETVIESSASDNEEIDLDVNKSNISHKSKSGNTSKSKSFRKVDSFDDSDDRIMGSMSESIFAVKEKSKSPPVIEEKKNFVFCTTRLSSNQMNELKELCDIYGGKISTHFTNEVTHLVVNLENGRISQTLKYFHAIACGKWVIIFDWVEDCLRANKLLPEDQYEVDVENFPFCDAGPRKSRLSSKRNLFDKVNFYFGDKPTLVPLEDCKQILEQLGAKVLDTYSKDFRESIIFIGDKENRKMNYMELFRSKCWITVTQEWILECLSSFAIVPLSEDFLVGNIGYHGLIHALLPKVLQKLRETFIQAGQTQYTCS